MRQALPMIRFLQIAHLDFALNFRFEASLTESIKLLLSLMINHFNLSRAASQS